MERRRFGATAVELPVVTFGTMRLADDNGGLSAAEVLLRLHDAGVTAHHSSFEYDSHPVYLAALADVRRTGRRTEHVVKLSEPSFDASDWQASRLVARIDAELTSLATERLDNVQWLVRTPDATDDDSRLAVIGDHQAEIAGTFDELRRVGKIGSVSSFPYSPGFATAALDAGLVDGLCTYLNFAELDYAPLVARTGFLAIRPLAAAALTARAHASDPDGPARAVATALGLDPDDLAAEAHRFPLRHPAVTSVIVSPRTPAQIDATVEAAATARVDAAAFANQVAQLQGTQRK
ncbi:MAG: aldo/keto reductase [Actinomycetota bacterium]